jgi:hypothetical protein
MAANLSGEDIRVFRCPNCKEFINTTLQQCRFCGAAIDPVAAEAAAVVQSKVNAVCNDASYARILAGSMWVLFFASFIPFLRLVVFGVYILFIAVPFLTVRSWWRIRAIRKPEDSALQSAAHYLRVALAIWIPMFGVMAIGILGAFIKS